MSLQRTASNILLITPLLALSALLLNGCGGSGSGGGSGGFTQPITFVPHSSSPTMSPTMTTSPSSSPSSTSTFVADPSWVAMGPNGQFDPLELNAVESGRTTSMLVSPSSDSTLLLGEAGGGIWRSTNGGTSWQPVTDRIPNSAIGSMAFDPASAGQTVYAGTGEAVRADFDALYGIGILKSTDGGQTFQVLPDPNRLFTGNGVSRVGVNNGIVFAAVERVSCGFQAEFPYTFSSNYQLPSTFGGIMRSSDGGTTFSDVGTTSGINGLPMTDLQIQPGTTVVPGTSGTILAAVDTSDTIFAPTGQPTQPLSKTGIWKSTDGGNTWTQSTGLPSPSAGRGMGSIKLAFSPSSPNVVYALATDGDDSDNTTTLINFGGTFIQGTSFVLNGAIVPQTSGGLYVSNDGGSTWNTVAAASGSNPADGTPPNTDFRNLIQNEGESTLNGGGSAILPIEPQADYDIALVVDPNNPHTCYVQAQQTARIDNVNPTNGSGAAATLVGVTDTVDNVGQDSLHPHTDQHFMAFNGAGSLYTCDDGGIWRLDSPSTSGESTPWVDVNSNLQTVQFYSVALNPLNSEGLIGGSQDNGAAINQVLTAFDSNPNDFLFDLPTAFGSLSTEWTADLGGDGGFSAFDSLNGEAIYGSLDAEVYFQYVFSAIPGGSDVVTINAATGIDFTNSQLFDFTLPTAISPTDNNRLLVGTTDVYECTTALSNLNFNDLTGQLDANPLAAVQYITYAPSNNGVIYASTTNGHIFVRTTQGGTFHQAAGSGLPSAFNPTSLAVDPTNPQHVFVTNALFQGSTIGQTSVGGLVFESTNSGQSWKDISGNLPDYPTYTIALDQVTSGALYVGNDVGVFVSTDDGASWSRYGSALPNARVWQLVSGKHGELLAGTHGRSAWETSSSSNLTITAPPATPPAVQGLGVHTGGYNPISIGQTHH